MLHGQAHEHTFELGMYNMCTYTYVGLNAKDPTVLKQRRGHFSKVLFCMGRGLAEALGASF